MPVWLCKHDIAHTTNYILLLELAKSLGATYLQDLHLGGNAHYTSERFIQEALMLLGGIISRDIFHQLRTSPFFALMCDKTTDEVNKEVIVYARYINSDRTIQIAFVT